MLVITLLILFGGAGGGGETQARGGKSQGSPPPLLYATLTRDTLFHRDSLLDNKLNALCESISSWYSYLQKLFTFWLSVGRRKVNARTIKAFSDQAIQLSFLLKFFKLIKTSNETIIEENFRNTGTTCKFI